MLECVHAHIRTEKNSNIAQFYYRIAKEKGNSKVDEKNILSSTIRFIVSDIGSSRFYSGLLCN